MTANTITHQVNTSLCWQVVDQLPDPAETEHIHQSNCETLKQVLLLDEFCPAGYEDQSPESRDSHRLERKLDLLLSLIGSIIHQQRHSGTCEVSLAMDQLQWMAPQTEELTDGQLLCVHVYLHPYAVSPVTVFAPVSVQQQRCNITLEFLQNNESELWQRYIFLNHRRHIAAARQATRLTNGHH